jgi:hypothetical protein
MGTFVDIAFNAGSFKTLGAAFQPAGKVDALRNNGTFSVVAAHAGIRWLAKSDFG